MKHFALIFFLALFLYSCNQSGTQSNTDQVQGEPVANEIVELTVAGFLDKAPEMVDKQITISGLVVHTCKHGGKRMFITDEGTEERVKIVTGGNIDNFDTELEGSVVVIEGILKEERIDNAYLDEWEKEIEGDMEEQHKIHEGDEHTGEEGEEHTGEEGEETEEDHHGTDPEKIQNLRKELADSGKDYLSFYSVECIKYSVAPPPPPTE
ncbi:MAG: hypothetical protein K8R53_05900 [Bacteroidales bacterium]|nr:hypothetical protein [Bacteroidales bacterium]